MSRTETPLLVPELRKLFPHIPLDTLYKTSRTLPGYYSEGGVTPRQIRERLPWWFTDPVGPKVFEYTVGKRTYVAREKLKDRCGVHKNVVAAWVAKGDIDDGVRRRVECGHRSVKGCSPPYRDFYWKEQIDAKVEKLDVPPNKLPKPRTPGELKRLDDDEYVTIAEMESVGVLRGRVWLYWDWPAKSSLRPREKDPLLGRQIKTKPGERVVRRKGGPRYILPEALVRWGDIRELLATRDNPPVPEGGVLVRDAIPKLKAIGIKLSHACLLRKVKFGAIEGGEVDAVDKRFRPRKLVWMKWSEREKLRARHQVGAFEKPGSRFCWIAGEDWHPANPEGWRLAGCRYYWQLKRWMPTEYGGLGKPCPYLPGRTVRCQLIPIANYLKPDLIGCAGEDLRDIAEALTGKRPTVPPRRADVTATAPIRTLKTTDGNGQLDQEKQPADEWIRVSVAADRLDVHKGQVTRAVDAGYIRCNGREGTLRRVSWTSCQKWDRARSNAAELKAIKSLV